MALTCFTVGDDARPLGQSTAKCAGLWRRGRCVVVYGGDHEGGDSGVKLGN